MIALDRNKGTLVGVHIGDSIGAPYETWGPKAIAEDIEKRGGLTFFEYPNPWAKDGNGRVLPAGRPTDDSDQTADLCYSLIACQGLNPVHLRDSLQNSVYRNISRLWGGKATGSGATTKDALSDDPERVKRGLANTIGTNGSVMRCSPMALWLAHSPLPQRDLDESEWCRKLVHDMSRVTHTHQHCLDACWLYTKVLVHILREGHEWKRPQVDYRSPLETRVWSRLDDYHDLPYDPGAWPARGTAEFSLYVALYALRHSRTFAEGIEIAIRVGGDTDTYGAIAGGLLGALYGYDAIPIEWRHTIKGHDAMVEYATQIFELRNV